MKTAFKSIKEFKEELATNPALQAKFQNDPVAAAAELEPTTPIYFGDKLIYRMVVAVLGIIVLAVVTGVIILSVSEPKDTIDKYIPTVLTATASAALGALTGLFAPSPNTPAEPQ